MLSFNIKTKLLLLRLGVGVVMAVAIGMSTYFIARNSAEKTMMESLEFDSEKVAQQLLRFFEQKIDSIKSITTDPAFAKYTVSSREPLLLALFSKHKDTFSSLSFVNTDGQEEVKVVAGKISQDFTNVYTNPNYVTSVKNPNIVVISDFVPSGISDQNIVELYLSVIDFFDQPLGCIKATLSGPDFMEVLGGKIFNTGGIVTLLDSSNNVVAGIFPDATGQDTFDAIRDDPVFNKHNSESLVRKDPLYIYSFLDRSWNLTSTTVDFVDYKAVIWASHKQLYSSVVELRNTIFMLAFFFVIAAEVFSRVLGLKITEPVEELNRLTAEIAESGSVTERVGWQSRDELGQLADSFNMMLDKLETVMVDLEKEKVFSQGVISSMADMLAVVTVKDGIMTVNRSLCSLLGYDAEELIGKSAAILFPGHEFSVDEGQLFDSAGSGIPFRAELEYQTKSGEPVAVDFVRSTLLDQKGDVFAVVFVAKDIRSDKAIEEERRKSEERVKQVKEELFQTEKMALVGQMSGMVAHEVLNPISAINVRVALNLQNSGELKQVVGVLQKIVKDWAANNTSGTFAEYFSENGSKDLVLLGKIADMLEQKQEERQEDLQFIEKLIIRVIKTIDGFREMSRQRETIENVSLSHVTQEILEDMQDGITKRHVVVSTDCKDGVVVRADFMEIYSIISNIIRNGLQAIDSRRDQGERTIDISIEGQVDGMARILIKDSGTGMDTYTRENVFEPDFTSKGRKGTGIGMSFSRKIARKYGGDIRILESGINSGTTFEILLQRGEETT